MLKFKRKFRRLKVKQGDTFSFDTLWTEYLNLDKLMRHILKLYEFGPISNNIFIKDFLIK